MEVKPTVLVLADISGYTRFVSNHNKNLLHAEKIITDLLEAVINRSDHPLRISKLEGDAVFFYCPIDDDPRAVVQDVIDQVLGFFEAFRHKEQEIVSCNVCVCEACRTADRLRLKAFIHTGSVAYKQVAGFQELAGNDVILVHRLMKNTVPASEYLMMTDAVRQLGPELPGWPTESRIEDSGEYGVIPVTLLYPEGLPDVHQKLPVTWWDKARHLASSITYYVLRRTGLIPRPVFNNLPDPQ
jgi:class 3 adenylate cyclase